MVVYILLPPGVSIALSSRAVSSQVLSAQVILTTVFGMGTGGPSPLKTLTTVSSLTYASSVLSCCSHDLVCDIKWLCHLVHLQGFEPGTHWLRVSCSTNWAKGASLNLSPWLKFSFGSWFATSLKTSSTTMLWLLRNFFVLYLSHILSFSLGYFPLCASRYLDLENRIKHSWILLIIVQALGLLVSVS